MSVLRLVREDDLAGVLALAKYAGAGLTTLPADEALLKAKILDSCRSVEYPPSQPHGESFLFVLEKDEIIIGTCAVYTKVGGFDPFWTYKIRSKKIRSKSLKVNKKIQYLQVKKEHSGPSEIGTLFLHPDYRKDNHGRMLSLSRFLFMAHFRGFFEKTVLAEMRGRIDEKGNSPFWDCVGSHFFDLSLMKADLMVNRDKTFIDDLFPKHPIYIPMLSLEAQEVIGKVHEKTAPAKHLLESEGFKQINEVDIFEGGAILKVKTDSIRSVKQSQLAYYAGVSHRCDSEPYLIARCNDLNSFTACVSPLEHTDEGLFFPAETVDDLSLEKGDLIRFVKLRMSL
jgi:arginine N-succinyltransferase